MHFEVISNEKKHVRKWYNQDWYQYIIRDFWEPEPIANIYNLTNSKPYKLNQKKFKPWPKSYQDNNVSVFICELVQPLTLALIHNSHRILLDYQCSKVTCQGFTKYHEIIFLELFDLWSWGRVTINSNSLSLILMF